MFRIGLWIIILSLLFPAMARAEGVTDKPTLQKLEFEPVKYTNASIENYPFLGKHKDIIIKGMQKEHNSVEDYRVYMSTSNFNCFDNDLLLLQYQDPLSCGTRGCTTEVYEVLSNEFKRIKFYVTTNLPIYKQTCGEKDALILTGGGGTSSGFHKWACENGGFNYVKTFQNIKEISACIK